jgi:hypothetical protein
MVCCTPSVSENPATKYDSLLIASAEVLPTIYVGDDLSCILPPALGLVDASSVIQCALVFNTSGVLATAWIPQIDLANGNNFSQGIIRPVISDTVLTALPTGRYNLLLRVSTSSITQTFKTYKLVVLALI